jgi:hypothetical protein
MKSATYYNQHSGQIVGCSIAPLSDILSNKPVDADILWGLFEPDLYYVKGGEPVEFPEKPDYLCKFDFDNEVWVDSRDSQYLSDEVRTKRGKLLYESDWTQLPDTPVDSQAWATYRQALRDITSQVGFPESVVWPTPPQ